MALDEILEKIGASREDIIRMMCGMTAIPSISPAAGGTGESARADFLMDYLKGFDTVERIDIPYGPDSSIMRPNLLARKIGKKKGTVWIMAHIDTVPAGDLDAWDTNPFEGVVKGDRIYGRGTEDNGQTVVSSYFATRDLLGEELNGMSIGLVWVADEEMASVYGVEALIARGCFSEDDVFIVPDWGSPEGKYIEVSEKSLIWLNFSIIGKSGHGSTPDRAVNSLKIGAALIGDLGDVFRERFPLEDPMYTPSKSTFEPTRADMTVLNVNTIPGSWSFSMDCRILPCYSPDDVLEVAKQVAERYSKETGAEIEVTEIQRHVSGGCSSTEGYVFDTLRESVKEVMGHVPETIGIGGATCANFFRLAGHDAYVWETGGGTLHGPNEYVEIQNIINDAKVFATMFWKLCVR